MLAMSEPVSSLERRKHPRAQLKLPARIRWPGPSACGSKRPEPLMPPATACCFIGTSDATGWRASGLLSVRSRRGHRRAAGDAGADRSRGTRRGGGYWVALRFESTARTAKPPSDQERRGSERIPFALPIFVRLAGTPWPEEFMTQDIRSTARGLKPRTSTPWATRFLRRFPGANGPRQER